MKKIILALLFFGIGSSLFATSLEERVKVLEEKVTKLEKLLNVVNSSQKVMEKQLDNGINRCNKLKLLTYSFNYNDSGFTKTYDFKYSFQNNYPKEIKYIYGTVSFLDTEKTKLVEDYIKKYVEIKPHQIVEIKTNYLIDTGSLAEYLIETPKKDIHTEFKIFSIEFKDGQIIKCQ